MFKKGDRVRCINDTPYVMGQKGYRLKKGEVYTVRERVSGGYLVFEEFYDIQKTHNYSEDRFVKIDCLPEDLFTI